MSDTPKPTAADAYETTEALLCEMQGLRDELVEVKRERDEARMALQSIVKKMLDQAAVFKREDLRDNGRWSIFNEGRAQALEKFASDLEDVI